AKLSLGQGKLPQTATKCKVGSSPAMAAQTGFSGIEWLRGRLTMRKTSNRLMTRQQLLDLYFMEARAKLIDLGAFIDRVERGAGDEDFRMKAFRTALLELGKAEPQKARRVLLSLSDPTAEPIPAATTKAASGAYPGK